MSLRTWMGGALPPPTPHAPSARRFTSPNQLFDVAPDLDGVVIATPSAQHTEQCIAGLKRGLAVFSQKPLGRNAAEVGEAIDAARSMNRLLGVDLSYRGTR